MFLYRRHWRRVRNLRGKMYWINPYITKRKELGDFYTIFMDLREHGNKFLIYF